MFLIHASLALFSVGSAVSVFLFIMFLMSWGFCQRCRCCDAHLSFAFFIVSILIFLLLVFRQCSYSLSMFAGIFCCMSFMLFMFLMFLLEFSAISSAFASVPIFC